MTFRKIEQKKLEQPPIQNDYEGLPIKTNIGAHNGRLYKWINSMGGFFANICRYFKEKKIYNKQKSTPLAIKTETSQSDLFRRTLTQENLAHPASTTKISFNNSSSIKIHYVNEHEPDIFSAPINFNKKQDSTNTDKSVREHQTMYFSQKNEEQPVFTGFLKNIRFNNLEGIDEKKYKLINYDQFVDAATNLMRGYCGYSQAKYVALELKDLIQKHSTSSKKDKINFREALKNKIKDSNVIIEKMTRDDYSVIYNLYESKKEKKQHFLEKKGTSPEKIKKQLSKELHELALKALPLHITREELDWEEDFDAYREGEWKEGEVREITLIQFDQDDLDSIIRKDGAIDKLFDTPEVKLVLKHTFGINP